ncbi:transposase [Halorhodospira halophila]|uniref:transposase n=1 Tax=Halorhodospira halophila TaxID=1053 RepID=UPI003B848281
MEPFKGLALTLKADWQGILNAFDSRMSNGQIQVTKGHARGFRTTKNLITKRRMAVEQAIKALWHPPGWLDRPAETSVNGLRDRIRYRSR